MANSDAGCCVELVRVILLSLCALSILGGIIRVFSSGNAVEAYIVLLDIAFSAFGAYAAYKRDYRYLTIVSNLREGPT